MALSNDERGWVMTCLSGIACVLGASVICIDVLVRQFPGKRDFRIQDSDTFLSVSLSLSFGVMLFSALYSMLPSSKSSLIEGGFTPKQASWTLIVCFIGGVIGIQVLSRIMHHFIPSHVVDCEHTHDEEESKLNGNGHGHVHAHSYSHSHEQISDGERRPASQRSIRRSSLPGHMFENSSGRNHFTRKPSKAGASEHVMPFAPTAESQTNNGRQTTDADRELLRRPSLHERVTNTLSQLTATATPQTKCDSNGPCYGFTDPCGQECFKNVNARGGFKAPIRHSSNTIQTKLNRSATTTAVPANESTPLLRGIDEEQARPQTDQIVQAPTRYSTSGSYFPSTETPIADDSSDTLEGSNAPLRESQTNQSASSSHHPPDQDLHHHHVPTNAFLSIGLQTSFAIALHKLPEGFITYATNHANPKLGVAVFLALFIHNITEGFAMALPLYLAINSRAKAMAISFVLGGLSQPIGAAVAAIWFKLAGKGEWAPSDGVYGGMFAVTAGIMASVALQLFSESLDLTHSRSLCMIGAFAGMAILGVSSALTA